MCLKSYPVRGHFSWLVTWSRRSINHWKLLPSDKSPPLPPSLMSLAGGWGVSPEKTACTKHRVASAGCHYLRLSAWLQWKSDKTEGSKAAPTLSAEAFSWCLHCTSVLVESARTQLHTLLIMKIPIIGKNVTFPSGKSGWHFPQSLIRERPGLQALLAFCWLFLCCSLLIED